MTTTCMAAISLLVGAIIGAIFHRTEIVDWQQAAILGVVAAILAFIVLIIREEEKRGG